MMRHGQTVRRLAFALTAMLLASNDANALPPPPSADHTGDNVRIVEWERSFPIPGLSRTAKFWLANARERPMPAVIARRVYAERRARVIELATSPEVMTLLGLTPDVDTLEALPGEASWRVVAMEQRHRGALVRGARIALNIAGDGISIALIVSTAQPDLAPPEAEIAPDEAVTRALEVAPELSSIPLAAREFPPPLLVVREPAMFGGARRATEVRRGNDQLVYAVRLTSDDVVEQEVADVWVDAASGQISLMILLASHPSSVPTKPIGKAITAGQAAFQNALIPLWLCLYNEGDGEDTDQILRLFSTTYYPNEQNPWALVSCNEWGTPERLVNAQDVVTFRDSPLVDPKFDQADVFRDDDDSWISNDPLIRHAVNGQYWGERALRYFKKNGYTKRFGSGIPVRYVGWQKGFAEQALFTKLKTSLGTDNGVISVGVGGERFKTSADPMVLAHELGHSLWADVLPHPADETEEKAIYEGLSDCFAMAAMNDMQQEWLGDPANSPPHPGYQNLGTYAPFSFWAGSYVNKDTAKSTPGYPNLWNPKKSWPLDWPKTGFKFTTWSGSRSTFTNYEQDSTLFGAVCRLMVTGGPTVAVENTSVNVPAAVTGGGSLHDALASTVQGVVDRQLGFARLTRLMMVTFLEAKEPPTSFHDLIDILAVYRKMLASTEWFETDSEERMRRTFAEYGFGRGSESEPNDAITVSQVGPTAAANLIAVGSNFSRPITGTLCDKDEDFFVVNETVAPGDEIEYSVTPTKASSTTPTFDLRFYRHKPCAFSEGMPKTCALNHQIHPPTSSDGSTTQTAEHNDTFVFKGPTGGGCSPGVPCGSQYWKLFVGVRLKSGTCKSDYKLSLKFKKRAKGVE